MLDQSVSCYYRITTNGTMRNYRSGLLGSRNRLVSAMTKVQTGRQFTSYAEDPAAASEAWTVRRSVWRTQDQINNVQTLCGINQSAFTAVDAICDGTTENRGLNGYPDVLLQALNDPTGSGRKALGTEILAECEALVSNMNAKYGDNYIFAGTDGLNVPFTWNGGTLLYRGIDVSAKQMEVKTLEDFPADDGSEGYDEEAYQAYLKEYAESDYGKLEKYSQEKTYVDIGMGFKENENGEFIPDTGYNSALCGINFLGFGLDEDGDSNNIVTLMHEVGEILSRTDPNDGSFYDEKGNKIPFEQEGQCSDRQRLNVLTTKIINKIYDVSEKHTELTAQTDFLQKTGTMLEERMDLMEERRMEIENVDPAVAISEMLWANYSYQSALKIGNSILSQSLLDYMT